MVIRGLLRRLISVPSAQHPLPEDSCCGSLGAELPATGRASGEALAVYRLVTSVAMQKLKESLEGRLCWQRYL